MADTTFNMIVPALKAVDLDDGTYALALGGVVVPAGGTNVIILGTDPPLRGVDLGDGTYAISVTIA